MIGWTGGREPEDAMEDKGLDPLRALVLRQWRVHGRETPVEGLLLTCLDAPSGPLHAVYRTSLCVVLQGAKTSMLGEHAFRYDAGKCLIASVEVPIRAEITRASAASPYLAFSLAIDPATVADLLLEQGGAGPGTSTVPALGVHALAPELIDPLCRLVALCDRPQDIAVLAPLIRREIVWRLLQGPMGRALRQIGVADSRMARIGRAIAHIRKRFSTQIDVRALAGLAGMSPATFHRHFKAVTGMSPVQYQKQLRLQEARRLLLADGAEVASIGFAIGYESPSQFSREYRRLFGVPPGRDGQQIRKGLFPPVDA